MTTTAQQKQGGGTATLAKIAYRNIWRNPRRTAFCFAAVGIAVFFITVYSGYIGGMLGSMTKLVQVFELGHVQVVSQEFEADQEFLPVQYPVANGRNWRELADEIKQISGVRAVFPRINTMATLQESTVKHAVLWGLNIEDETAANNFNLTNRSNGLIEGRFPKHGANEAAVGHIFAQRSGLTIGDRIPLMTVSAQFSNRIWSPVITGIYDFDFFRFDERFIIVDFERLQRLLSMGDGTQQLIIFADDEKLSAQIAAKIKEIVGEENIATQWRENYWVAVMEAMRPMYVVIFLVFLIVASFLIVNTVVMIVHERIKEIGMMGCLGMTRREIVTVFFFESLFMAALGALIGVIFGGILTAIGAHFPLRIGDMLGNQFSEMPLANVIFLEFNVWNLVQAWIMGVVVASLFTLIPSLKSAFVEPVEALRR